MDWASPRRYTVRNKIKIMFVNLYTCMYIKCMYDTEYCDYMYIV